MKHRCLKIWGVPAVLLLGASLLQALEPGDPAAELRAEFVFHGPVALTGPADPAKGAHMKVLVFFQPRQAESRNLMTHLMDLNVRYPQVEIVALSPDGKEEAQTFFSIYSHNSFAGAADVDLQSSKAYLSGQPVYPYSFIISEDGIVLWEGEAVDLGEALDMADRKMLDVTVQKQLSPLLADLRSRFRNGEERMARYAAEKIFALDPANSAAIRMRLFMLQGAGKTQEARDFLAARRKAAPKAMKLYFLQLDLTGNSADDDALVRSIATAYRDEIQVNLAGDSAMAWQLLTRRPFDPAALRIAGQLIGRTMAFRESGAKKMQPADADLYMSAALYASRIGRLDKAVVLQKKATDVLEKTAPHRALVSRKMEQYYRGALHLTRENGLTEETTPKQMEKK